MMRYGIVWVHCQSALQSADGELRFPLFRENFSHQDVWAGRSRIEPDGALQELFGFVEFLDAGICVGKLVVCGSIPGIELQLLLKFVRRFRNFGVIQVQLAEEKMHEWKLGIERGSFLRVFFGNGSEIPAQQHAGGEEVAGGGIGGDAEHFREGAASVRIILYLDVTDAQNIT